MIEHTGQPNTYRFKLSEEVTDAVTRFSRKHAHDNRSDYKEAWREWCEEHLRLVTVETDRLRGLGYTGDICEKMYKAGRYYFRKKDFSETAQPQERRNYVSMEHEVLSAMVSHIHTIMNNEDFTPANGYGNFCQTNIELLREEVKRLCEAGQIDGQSLAAKIKKTYKNRYFMISRGTN